VAAKLKVRKVANKEDRRRPSVFIRLKTDEQFRGYALFEPDPELADNPGFFEYFTHWDQQGNTYVPCAGEKCPFCLANDNPATQAMTLWHFPDNDAKDQLKVFTMNVSTVRDITDIAEEEDGIIGNKFRIKRMSDKGEYRIRPLADKALTKKEISTLLKDAPDLEEMIERQLKVQWERLKALDALEDDEDDEDDEENEEEEPKQKARRGRPKADADDEDENEEEEDEEDEDEEDEEDEEEDENEDEEDDEDEEAEDEDENEDEEDEEDETTEVRGAKLEIVSVNEDDETLNAKNSDGTKYELWQAEGVDFDFAKMKKGVKITVDADKDDEGDWVVSSISVSRARATTKK
jgi:hypothetical protein